MLRERMSEPGIAERFATAVAALETLRMDLLRLHAGNTSLDELTQDLAAAQRVGEEIDAEVAGVREVQDPGPVEFRLAEYKVPADLARLQDSLSNHPIDSLLRLDQTKPV